MAQRIFSAYLCVLSAVTFVLYLLDKKRAREGRWRIDEKTLLAFSFLGGAVGGYVGMFLARHKVRKAKFHVINLLGIAWQVALLLFLIA